MLVKFMSSLSGRILRFVMGTALVAFAATSLTGAALIGVTAFGVVAMLAGLANFCLLAPLLGAPFFAPRISSR